MRVKRWAGVFFVILFALSAVYGDPADPPFLPGSVLGLDDVVAVALSHQPQVKAAEQNVKAALSRGSQATADYYPQIAFDSAYQRGNYEQIAGPAQTLIFEAFTEYTANFSANLIVEDFGKRHAVVGQAKAQAEQAQAEYHDARGKVIFDAAQAYFKALQAQKLEEVNQKLEEAGQTRLEQAKGFVETGEKPKLDLLAAQAAYLSAQFNYLKSEQDLADAQTRLNTAMGISNPPPYTLKEEFALPPFPVDLAGAKAAAFRNKPQLVEARARVAEMQGKVNEMRAGRWPVVSASGLYGWVDSKFPPGVQSWLLGTTLHWPLFDGNKLTHQINEAVSLKNKAQEDEETLRLQVNQDVEQRWRAFQSAQERLNVARDEVVQAQEAARLADRRYKIGLAAYLEVADAQAKLAQAREHEVEAVTDYRLSQSALKRSMGIEEP